MAPFRYVARRREERAAAAAAAAALEQAATAAAQPQAGSGVMDSWKAQIARQEVAAPATRMAGQMPAAVPEVAAAIEAAVVSPEEAARQAAFVEAYRAKMAEKEAALAALREEQHRTVQFLNRVGIAPPRSHGGRIW